MVVLPVTLLIDRAILSCLCILGEHDNGGCSGLPDHPPEVVDSRVFGALGSHKLFVGIVATNIVGVDVVGALQPRYRAQLHSGVVVRQNVAIPR